MAKTAARQITGGYLNVNKGAGLTSMDVLRRIKRITGQQKVGHAGTLDPDATGVLPVAIGKATKFVDHVMHGRKRYSMTVRLGSATDTYDASGEVTVSSDASSITEADVAEKLPDFTGELTQIPPMYSAIKRNGTPLYKLARQGVEVGPAGEGFPLAIDVHGVLVGNQRDGEVRAEARIVRRGRRVTVVRTRITGEDGRLLGEGRISVSLDKLATRSQARSGATRSP